MSKSSNEKFILPKVQSLQTMYILVKYWSQKSLLIEKLPQNDEQVKPLCSKLPQLDGYENSFKEAKQLLLLIKNEKFLKKMQ